MVDFNFGYRIVKNLPYVFIAVRKKATKNAANRINSANSIILSFLMYFCPGTVA